jgi:hypothetical protein
MAQALLGAVGGASSPHMDQGPPCERPPQQLEEQPQGHQELRLAPGTVKSRLARGRAAMASHLHSDWSEVT